MQREKGIQVVPDSVFFRDLKPGESDSADVWIMNTGSKPVQLRVFLPRDSPFHLSSGTLPLIAPGLEIKISLNYKATGLERVESSLKVECQTASISIPVSSIPPCSRIIPEKYKVDLGNVAVGSTGKFSFNLSNIGIMDGEFELSCDSKYIEIVQAQGKILMGKSVEITCNYRPTKTGDFKTLINIDNRNPFENVEPVEITAIGVQHSLALLVEGKEVKDLDFGAIFVGQKRVISATVVNRGPGKRSFVVMPPREALDDSPRTGAANLPEEEEGIFSAVPPEGLLNPYGSSVIRFVFNPPVGRRDDEDLGRVFMQYTTIEVVETHQKLDIPLEGKGVLNNVTLSTVDFNFERVSAKQKLTQTLTITNESKFLPITYEVKPVAHFRFEPAKGTIKMGGKKTVTVIFYPKNLGVFDTETMVVFCSGLNKRKINLSGCCGDENKEFTRKPAYEKDEEAKFRVMHPDSRFAFDFDEVQKRQGRRKEFDRYLTDAEDERTKRSDLKEMMVRMRREAITNLDRGGSYTEEDIEEYIKTELMPHAERFVVAAGPEVSDLTPPEPIMNRRPAPLYLEHPEAFGLVAHSEAAHSTSKKRVTEALDENVLIKNKFKAKATTPGEVNECTKPLTPAQQLQVTASHKVVDIGQIAVFGTVEKSFAITNNLDQNIVVAVKYEFEELEKSGPVSQVIPAKQTAGFDIKFYSRHPVNFMKALSYTINGHHTCTFNVSAQVVPIELQLSREIIEFRFSPDATDPIIREYVTVQNRSNARAEFSWQKQSGPFSIGNSPNFVEPNKVTNVEIVYRPTTRSHDEATFVMNVNGGSSRALKCIGDVGSPKCSLTRKNISFGLIPIGIVKVGHIRIKNSKEEDAIFTVGLPKGNTELQVQPMNGKVSGHDTQSLEITYNPTSATYFDLPVTVSICGAADLSFTVTGQSELPKVQMVNSEFEFGRVFVGATASISATISNIGAIPAVLLLDLSSKPEFRIEFPTELNDSGGAEQKNSIALVSDQLFVTKMEGVKNYMSPEAASLPVSRQPTAERERGAGGGLMYKIQLLEKTTIIFNLVFQPTAVNDHSFELPISMMNVLGTPSFHLQPIVSAEAVTAPIEMSVTSAVFGVRPLHDDNNPNCPPSCRLVGLTNGTSSEVKWNLDVSGELFNGQAVFRAEPVEGTIAAGAMAQVKLYFSPRKAMPYNAYLPLMSAVPGKDNCRIGQIQLTGVGTSRVFKASSSEVSMPVIPVGVKAEMEVWILNIAAVSGLLKIQMAVDESVFPLKVSFPEGNQLQHATERLAVLLTFEPTRPVSFSTLVAIIDDYGNATSFAVTCTADNSVFSLYPYLSNKCTPQNGTIEKMQKDFIHQSELTARFASVSDVMDLQGRRWKPSFPEIMVTFFQRYMNALVLKTPISDFPGDCIRGQGAIIMETLGSLSGKKQSGSDVDRNDNVTGEEAFARRLDGIKKLIVSLQSIGALISGIKPEYLMTRADFMQIMRGRITKQLMELDYFGAPDPNSFDQKMYSEYTSSSAFSNALIDRLNIMDDLYSSLSRESWMIITTQLFKLFVMARVDIDKMHNVPGVANAMKQVKQVTSRSRGGGDLMAEINKSTKGAASPLVNAKESGLLRWALIHHCANTGDRDVRIRDFAALSDSVALASLMKAHTTALRGTINPKPTDKAQCEQNAIEVTSAMRELKMTFCPLANEIFDGTQCMMATTLAFLYSVLPHYIPTTSLEFNTGLHKTVTKAISLMNPSKSEVVYKASLEGDRAFTLEHDTVSVSPGQSVDFPVQFKARTMRPLVSRLSMIPSKSRQVREHVEEGASPRSSPKTQQLSAPVVVDLMSSVSISSPNVTSEVETHIYRPVTVSLRVQNVLEVPAKLTIYSHVSCIADEKGTEIPQSRTLTQQVSKMISDSRTSDFTQRKTVPYTDMAGLVEDHKSFLLSTKNITFDSASASAKLDVEFVPIELGTFRCLLLFMDADNGEFLYEIKGKSILPDPVEISAAKLKCEAGKRGTALFPIDPINVHLLNTIVYSRERSGFIQNPVSDRKFRDTLTRAQQDILAAAKQSTVLFKYSVHVSSGQYFDAPGEMSASAKTDQGKKEISRLNALSVTFRPSKAGEYPCRIVLVNSSRRNDVQCFQLKAVSVPPVRELSLDFSTVAGRAIKQDLPFSNPSEEVWNYKVTFEGDASFNIPQRFSVKGQSQGVLPVAFHSAKKGTYEGEMTVVNLTKDATTIYKLSAIVEEPPAEGKLTFDCRARQKCVLNIDVKPFVRNGEIQVTTTIPLIKFSKEFRCSEGTSSVPFPFSLSAPRSGLLAGTITFTDVNTRTYIWYIVEIRVDAPPPEQVIEVETVARESVTIKIPISNPKPVPVAFNVVMGEKDFVGAQAFSLDPGQKMEYPIVITPVKAANRTSSIYFYTDDDSEFWYTVRITATEPPENVMAPVTAAIGKSASIYVTLENSTGNTTCFRVENDDGSAWQVMAKRVIQIAAREKKKVELRYIPTSVGTREEATISFKSNELGDWVYKVVGTGKPPQPMSPAIVSAAVNQANSALVMFTNPFPYPSRFSVSLTTTDAPDGDTSSPTFKFLVKRKVFSLSSYGEEFQIPFTFSPMILGQFKASIVVAFLGAPRAALPELETLPTIRWIYPVIGNSRISSVPDLRVLKCRAQQQIEQELSLTLVGENDSFPVEEYSMALHIPKGHEYLRSALDLRPTRVDRTEAVWNLIIATRFSPQRPLQQSVSLTIRNPLNQEWQFQLDLIVDRGLPSGSVVIESLLHKTGTARVTLSRVFRSPAPFHAYFAPGSASEFTLSSNRGVIEPTLFEETEIPVDILFCPKMYGKLLKAVLVVDTMDTQFLFDVIGKTPEYVPPVIEKSTVEEHRQRSQSQAVKPPPRKRNIIRDNIENVKITKPRVDQKP